MRYHFAAERPVDLAIQVRRRGGRPVRRLVHRGARPGFVHRMLWGGLTDGGRRAPSGRYEVRVGRRGHRLRRVGGFVLRDHLFPVRGPHWERGYWGGFGAPREGGRRHEGFDVMAPCGTPLAAARGGRVARVGFKPGLDGHFVIIAGRRTPLTYRYSHLPRRPSLRRGQRVRTGRRIGAVGASGNAASVGCHLHIEIRRRGRPLDPAPLLRRWDSWS